MLDICYPLTELRVIGHEPDNRFIECALACDADFLVTVNTAKGHFDRPRYGSVRSSRQVGSPTSMPSANWFAGCRRRDSRSASRRYVAEHADGAVGRR